MADKRRNNTPPEHGKIKSGEIRNKWGRAGKPTGPPRSSIDDIYLKEGERIVSWRDGEPTSASQRFVQEEYQDALKERNLVVRARLLNNVTAASRRVESGRREFIAQAHELRQEYEEEFSFAERTRRSPPDVLHPAHVHISADGITFLGPVTKQERMRWEHLKAIIKIAAFLHTDARARYRDCSSEVNADALRHMESHRRKVMRAVLKGWNWRENIWCRYSQTHFVEGIVRKLTAQKQIDG